MIDPPVRPTNILDHFLSVHSGIGKDLIRLDVALVEGPVGDRFLGQEIWRLADDQVVSLESRARIEDNGFRVAQIGGMTPPELQQRLISKRSCPDPRRREVLAGKPASILLGTLRTHCAFEIHQEGDSFPVSLEQAQCLLVVVASKTADGKTRLQFVPQIQNGPAQTTFGPAADRSGWLLQEERSVQKYDSLGWEVTVEPNEYVIVGGRADRPGTLGHECFLRADEGSAKQNLLVLRAVSGGAVNEAAEQPSPSIARAIPLALQAAWPTKPALGASD
jgi:hypothetical protein